MTVKSAHFLSYGCVSVKTQYREKARIYVFIEGFDFLEFSKPLPAHRCEVFTFPPVDKGAGFFGEPFLFRTPVAILIRFITAFIG